MANNTNRILLANYLLGQGQGLRNYIKNPSAFRNTTESITLGAGVSAGDVTRNTSSPITAISDFQISLNSATNEYVDWTLDSFDRSDLNGTCEFSGSYKLSLGSGATVQAQVIQNSLTIATLDLGATSTARNFTMNFACGDGSSSTSVRFAQTATTNTSTLNVASLYVGRATNVTSVAQAELYGTSNHAATDNCFWQVSSFSGMTDFPVDADCPAPTVTGNAVAPSTKIPGVTFNNLPPGKYEVIASIAIMAPGSGTRCVYTISDGTSTGGRAETDNANVSGDMATAFTYTQPQSSVTFRIQTARTAGADTCGIALSSSASQRALYFTVKRFPLDSQVALKPDQQGWLVDANIGGANPSMGTGAVTSYTGIENSGLTLTNNSSKGSNASVQIPCSSTNSPSGNTCTSGDESVGVSFEIPYAGQYEACVAFSYQQGISTASGFASVGFQIVETPNNAQTISQEGGSRVNYVSQTSATTTEFAMPVSLCGTFSFSSVGRKTLRLMYEQAVSGTVAYSRLAADQDASTGQRDIHWTVRPLTQNITQPILVNGPAYLGRVYTDWSTNCVWANSAGASYTSFSADADCNIATATGSKVSAPGTKIPGITLSNILPGALQFVASGSFRSSGNTSNVLWRITDGTYTAGGCETSLGGNPYAGTLTFNVPITAAITSSTFQLQAATPSGTDTGQINNGASPRSFAIDVYWFPQG